MASINPLTKDMILQKSKSKRLEEVQNINLWGKEIDDVSILKETPNVEIVSLSLNKITSLKSFQFCKKLIELYLRKNQISSIQDLNYLKKCNNLKVLWLEENKICENENYRLLVIKTLPQLVKLDNVVITDEERENSLKLSQEINSTRISPKVHFKEEENNKLVSGYSEEYKNKQVFNGNHEERNNEISKIRENNLKPNSQIDPSKITSKEDSDRNIPNPRRDVNFNMQKISNLHANGFFGNPNKTDYNQNEGRRAYKYTSNNMNQNNPPTEYHPHVGPHTEELANKQLFLMDNNSNKTPINNGKRSENSNIVFALKCLLDELGERELEKAKEAVEKRLVEKRKMKYNNKI